MTGFACYLPDEAMLHLYGDKIPEFLQGQLSCDTRKLDETRGIMGALCNVKGRVLSDLTVLKISDSHLVLRLHRSLAAHAAETLQRYAQFSRIRVEVDTREDAIVGLYDPMASGDKQTLVGEQLATSNQGARLSLMRGIRYGEVISVDPQKPADLGTVIAEGQAGNPQAWAMELIAAGHYALRLEDLEAFTPQNLNYDLTGLVAFDKGCYTGQEIIARLHYKGRSKKRLHRYAMSSPATQVDRSTSVLTADGASVGRCLRVFTAPNTPALIAAEVSREHLNENLFLPTGDPLRSLNFDYPDVV